MKYTLMLASLFTTVYSFADDALIAAVPKEKQPAVQYIPKPVSPQYDNRFGFNFDRLVYERTKANAMYFGLDTWAAYCFNHSRHTRWTSVFEAEARLGYNLFYNGRDHFTPLFGTGYLYHNVGTFHHARFAYVTAGFLYSHEFNTVFGWGLNLKGLAGQQIGSEETKKFAWGVDLCIPIIFRFSHHRHWDVTLEPFYLYMESNHRHQGIFGGRGNIGYRF